MSGFELEPLDGNCLIPLPVGETLIGRGPLLRVSDKRVSRNHGLLEVVDGQLRIKPTHLNPCFYQSSLDDPPHPLEKDKWHPLFPGDLFSLLPGKYIYRVVSTDCDCTQRNSQALADDNDDDDVSVTETSLLSPRVGEKSRAQGRRNDLRDKTLGLTQEYPEISESSMEKECKAKTDVPPSKNTGGSAEGGRTEEGKSVQRKRVLPAWMLQGAAGAQRTLKSTGGEKQGRSKLNPEQPKDTGSRSQLTSSKSIEETDTRQASPGRKPKRKKCEEIQGEKCQATSSSAADNGRIRGEDEHSEESDKVSGRLSDDEELRHVPAGKSDPHSKSREVDLSDGEEKEGPSQRPLQRKGQGPLPKPASSSGSASPTMAGTSRKQPRNPCMYGTNCYRKNPVHFQEFSHPGDSDYEEKSAVSDDANDCRPECPYGTDCYRKNPQHRKEYRHTKASETENRRPKRKCIQKAGKKSALAGDDDDGEPNDYDLNDSFIDDEELEDSDHSDEDSDYVPDSDDSVAEDLNTLSKEAKEFMGRKK
ncbi:APLF factor, partial [Atractosteus spatula]|nr:APLF factor [Atractosteus spatula]